MLQYNSSQLPQNSQGIALIYQTNFQKAFQNHCQKSIE